MDHIVLVHRHSDCYFAFIALGAAAGRLNVPPLPRARRRQALPRAAAVPCRRPGQVVPLTFVLASDGSFVVALLEKSSCLNQKAVSVIDATYAENLNRLGGDWN